MRICIKKTKTIGWAKSDWTLITWDFKTCWYWSEWFGRFERKDWTMWWMSSNWEVLKEWFQGCWDFSEWVARFKDKNTKKFGLIRKDWTILIEWLEWCVEEFSEWYWMIYCNDWSRWLIDINGKIIIEWLDYIWKVKNWLVSIEWKWVIWNMSINFQSWYTVYKKQNSSEGWIDTHWKILNNRLYSKCYPFNEEIKWFAKFEKGWTISYMDTKWREWSDKEDRNWVIYLKRNEQWFNINLIR
jgi:hypothetical protein